MSTPLLPPDFADLIRCLSNADADHMLIGGYAVMAYGHIRATQDFDVWVRPTRENADRVMRAMEEFGLPPGLSAEDLVDTTGTPPTGFRFGRRPLAIGLITSVAGVDFQEAWDTSEFREIDGMKVRVIGREAILKNKRATGRAKDAADVEALENQHSEPNGP